MRKQYIIGQDEFPGKLVLGAGESFSATIIVPPGTSCDLQSEIELAGPGAELDLKGAILCFGNEDVRLKINVRHTSGGCTSRQLFKGLAGGTSRQVFDGLIYVAEDSFKTRAYQENHTILLSKEAFAESRPQLEIYADDVECSHGATSGSLDLQQQFYMRSRGIPEDEARKLQLIAFLAPVLDGLSYELPL